MFVTNKQYFQISYTGEPSSITTGFSTKIFSSHPYNQSTASDIFFVIEQVNHPTSPKLCLHPSLLVVLLTLPDPVPLASLVSSPPSTLSSFTASKTGASSTSTTSVSLAMAAAESPVNTGAVTPKSPIIAKKQPKTAPLNFIFEYFFAIIVSQRLPFTKASTN